MIVFRLIFIKFSPDLTGKGAEKSGRRWNSIGIPMIYTSESRALCTAEVAVHIPLGNIPKDFELISIYIPEDIKITETLIQDLPIGWKTFPHLEITQKIGDQFIMQNKFLVMKVPSAVVPGDYNYLINPRHPDLSKIEIIKKEPYEFDERFFNR
jgi:RES domain-containing protein